MKQYVKNPQVSGPNEVLRGWNSVFKCSDSSAFDASTWAVNTFSTILLHVLRNQEIVV